MVDCQWELRTSKKVQMVLPYLLRMTLTSKCQVYQHVAHVDRTNNGATQNTSVSSSSTATKWRNVRKAFYSPTRKTGKVTKGVVSHIVPKAAAVPHVIGKVGIAVGYACCPVVGHVKIVHKTRRRAFTDVKEAAVNLLIGTSKDTGARFLNFICRNVLYR